MKISELPEPYKTRAEKRRREDVVPHMKADVISKAFVWMKTPEGISFWNDVHEVQSVEQLPPIPLPTKGEICAILQQVSDEHDGQVNLDSRIMQEYIADRIIKLMEEHNGNI